MEYKTKELDIAMLILPQNGSMGSSEQISDRKYLAFYDYLQSRGLVAVNFDEDKSIISAALTDEGIDFISRGGFMAEEFLKQQEKAFETEKHYWHRTQRKRERRLLLISILLGAILGGLGGLYIQYYLQVL